MPPVDVEISVVVPVFNGGRVLGDALGSVLGQTHPPLEIVVVDDGSTDDSAAIAERHAPAVACLRRPHAGPAAARNAGVAQACAEWIAFLDADDRWEPCALEALASATMGVPRPDLVVGRSRPVWLDAASERHDRQTLGSALAALWSIPLMGNVLVRRWVFDRVGLFDPALRHGEDTDWFIRVKEAAVPTRVVDAVIHVYHRHGGSLSRQTTTEAGRQRWLALLRSSLARRRAEHAGGTPPVATLFPGLESPSAGLDG